MSRAAPGSRPGPSLKLDLRGRELDLDRPLVMGILNLTPDSFSDGGRVPTPAAARERALALAAEGADLLDLGAVSTRPGAAPVSADEEMHRLLPALAAVRVAVDLPLSIDTYRPEVAAAAADLGADCLNDVTALGAADGHPSDALARVAATHGLGLVLMHMRGTPGTMQLDTQYADLVGEVRAHLAGAVARAVAAGVARERILIDPGIGFGKSVEGNLVLLARLGELATLGQPILIGASRKSFIGKILDVEVDDRLEGSLAAAVAAVLAGAHVIRAHDVRATVRAVRIAGAVRAAGDAGAAGPVRAGGVAEAGGRGGRHGAGRMSQVFGLHWLFVAIDIALLSILIYRLLLLIRGTRAVQMFVGLLTIILLAITADWLDLGGLKWLISNLKTVWVVAFLVLFQPELRRGLAQIGQSRFFAPLVTGTRFAVLGEIVKAVEAMSEERIGGLIVLERTMGLRNYVETGTRLDAAVTAELLLTVFTPHTTLHDGAVIIHGDRIVAAGCILPLSQNPRLSQAIGTRHRAALGLAEETDAVVVVVSEETGAISIASDSRLIRRLDAGALRSELSQRFLGRDSGEE